MLLIRSLNKGVFFSFNSRFSICGSRGYTRRGKTIFPRMSSALQCNQLQVFFPAVLAACVASFTREIE